MPLIEAFLALALTMLSFSMIATMVVEVIQRLLKTRSKDLRVMLEAYYNEELAPRIEEELGEAVVKAEGYREQFIDELLCNPLMDQSKSFLHALINPRYFVKPAVELTTEDFLKKLATTPLGRTIKEKSEVEIDEAVDRMAVAYDKFGDAASDIFKRRSQLVSLGAGLLVALMLNVNALTILKTYLDDPVLREKVVAQADEITRRYEDFQAQRGRRPGIAPGEAAEARDKELKDMLSEISSNVDDLEATGISFGWKGSVAPKIYWGTPPPGESYTFQAKLWGSFVWLLGAVATGLLIGLGSPFWYNMVTKITAILRVARGGGAAGKPGEAGVGEPDPLKPHRDLFKISGGAPLAVRFQAVERRIKAAAEELREAEEALGKDPRSGVKADIAEVLRQALARELGQHRVLHQQQATVFPVEAFENPNRWVAEDSSSPSPSHAANPPPEGDSSPFEEVRPEEAESSREAESLPPEPEPRRPAQSGGAPPPPVRRGEEELPPPPPPPRRSRSTPDDRQPS